MDKSKLIGRIFSIVAKLIAILVFLERDVIKYRVKKFNSGSLSGISDRIFNNGIETIKSIENGENHVDQE